MSKNSETDRLTGLLTRTAFDDQFQSFIQSAAKTGQPISLAFIDTDNFLQINENFGHEGGDQVLQAIANILHDQAGEDAVIGRYGGDEFALVFPYMEREQAFLILERIRAKVEGQKKFGTVETDITITGGIASYPIDGSSESEIIRKADQAMYRGKKSGRNSVRLSYDEKMSPKTSHYTLTQLERLTNLSKEEGVGEAMLLREALDDLLLKYGTDDIES